MRNDDYDLLQSINVEAFKMFWNAQNKFEFSMFDYPLKAFEKADLLSKIDGKVVLNETGKILFAPADVNRDDPIFVLRYMMPSGAVQLYNFTGSIYLTFHNLFRVIQQNIPEFQDRSHSSTKFYKGLEDDEIKSIVLLLLCMKDYSKKEALTIVLDQSKISVNFDNIIVSPTKILERITAFSDIFLSSKMLDKQEHDKVMVFATNLFSNIKHSRNVQWYYKGIKNARLISNNKNVKERIFDHISSRGLVSRKQISTFLNIPERTTSYYLKSLVEDGKIIFVSENKFDPNAKYQVNEAYQKYVENKKYEPRVFYGKEEPKDAKDGDIWFEIE